MNNGFNASAQPSSTPVPTPRELMLAVERLKEDTVRDLLARNADVIATDALLGNGYTTVRGEGFTTLGYAAYFGRTVLMDMLLAAGSDINGKDARGNTPLMNALLNHTPSSVRFLLDGGASLEGMNGEGETVWDLAKKSAGMATMLREADESRMQATAAAGRTVRNISYVKQEQMRLMHAKHFTIKPQ